VSVIIRRRHQRADIGGERLLRQAVTTEADGGRQVSKTFPATIQPEDWFPCEPDENGEINLHGGGQYLAACQYFDRLTHQPFVKYVVVVPSYDDDGRLELVTEDGEVPVSEVSFLALLEGGK
jgi:hypothetical protein